MGTFKRLKITIIKLCNNEKSTCIFSLFIFGLALYAANPDSLLLTVDPLSRSVPCPQTKPTLHCLSTAETRDIRTRKKRIVHLPQKYISGQQKRRKLDTWFFLERKYGEFAFLRLGFPRKKVRNIFFSGRVLYKLA